MHLCTQFSPIEMQVQLLAIFFFRQWCDLWMLIWWRLQSELTRKTWRFFHAKDTQNWSILEQLSDGSEVRKYLEQRWVRACQLSIQFWGPVRSESLSGVRAGKWFAARQIDAYPKINMAAKREEIVPVDRYKVVRAKGRAALARAFTDYDTQCYPRSEGKECRAISSFPDCWSDDLDLWTTLDKKMSALRTVYK